MLMLGGQRETSPCHRQRGDMFRTHAVSQVGSPKHGHLLRQSASLAEQLTGVRENPQRFGRSVPLGCRHRRPKRQVKIQLFANLFGRGSKRLRQFYPLSKMFYGFGIRRAAECEMTSLEPVMGGTISEASFREMARHDFRLARHEVGKL